MKLSDFGFAEAKAPIVFIGKMIETDIETSEGELYWLGKLKDPVMVGCSVNKDIERHEVDELYVRASDKDSDLWVGVNGKDLSEGYFIPNWVADFSTGQEIEIYQSETIRRWAQGNRKERGLRRTADSNLSIRERIKARAERMAAKNQNPDGTKKD